jgi:hypothetical protein
MFEYKDFAWDRTDDNNVDLYMYQDREIRLNAGRGKGQGQATGEYERKLVFIGHYNTISGVLYKILEMDLEATEVKNFTKVLQDHKKYVTELFHKINIPVAEKKILVQAGQVEEK